MSAACATDKLRWGLERTQELWPSFVRSPYRSIAVFAHMGHTQRARILMNAYVHSQADESALREVERSAKEITPLSGQNYLLGRLAYLKGDRAQAAASFSDSLKRCEQHGWRPDVLRYRYALGRLMGGQRGAEQAETALHALQHEQGCHDPRRYMGTYFPELLELAGS
jgi:hypothetical protein